MYQHFSPAHDHICTRKLNVFYTIIAQITADHLTLEKYYKTRSSAIAERPSDASCR